MQTIIDTVKRFTQIKKVPFMKDLRNPTATLPGDRPWWKTGVVYQVYIRSFQDSNGDGIGDFNGLTSRIGYLADLGIDAIWISPFYPSPMKDFGYDVSNYTDVDPMFGTLADFDHMMAEAHRQGLNVIIDWIPNHSSDQHPWFKASRSRRDDPHRDWYIWKDPKPDGSVPNNWLSPFGGSTWAWDETTGQYYFHSFLKEQPDLNWRNPGLRMAMIETLEFWLERGVDGFRIDVAHHIMKDPDFRDNPPNRMGISQFHKDLGEYDSLLHIHDRCHSDIHDVYRAVRRFIDRHGNGQPRVSIGEIHLYDPKELIRFYGAALDEIHLPFNFTLLATAWNAEAVHRCVDAMEAALPVGAWPNWVLGNHDEHRVATRIGEAAARIAMMLLLTLRGTPTLYYGEELGMLDVPIPPEQIKDPWEKQVPGLGLGRDSERTPMLWDTTRHAGFTTPTAKPWLPLSEDAAVRNVAVQRASRTSMLNLTHALLSLRRKHSALHRGSYQPVADSPEGTFVYQRFYGNDRLAVLLNFGARPVHAAVPGGRGTMLLSTCLDTTDEELTTTCLLRPNEGVIIELRD